jgi:hypothetical protein
MENYPRVVSSIKGGKEHNQLRGLLRGRECELDSRRCSYKHQLQLGTGALICNPVTWEVKSGRIMTQDQHR